MDEASYRGRETETKALGKTWRVSRWTLNVLDEFNDWARTILPDPLAVAEKEVLRLQRGARTVREDRELDDEEKQFRLQGNLEQQERISRLAMDEATSYLSLQSKQFQSLINSARGAAHLLLLLLREHQPDITEDVAFGIASGGISPAEMQRIMEVTAGKASGGNGRGSPRGNASSPAAAKRPAGAG
jgi:hypothetical protein